MKVADRSPDFARPTNDARRPSVTLIKTAAAVLRTHRARQNEERLAAHEWRAQYLATSAVRVVEARRVGALFGAAQLGQERHPAL